MLEEENLDSRKIVVLVIQKHDARRKWNKIQVCGGKQDSGTPEECD